MPRVLPRPSVPNPDLRRLLALLASSRDGLTERTMLKHGCTALQISELVQQGLAPTSLQRIPVGNRIIEVARVRIAEAGRQALQPVPENPRLALCRGAAPRTSRAGRQVTDCCVPLSGPSCCPNDPDQQARSDEASNQIADPSSKTDPEYAQNGAGSLPQRCQARYSLQAPCCSS
jgi:hypothetical protein